MIKFSVLQADNIEVKDSTGNVICSISDGDVGCSPNYSICINGAKYDDEEEAKTITIKGQNGAFVSAFLAISPKRTREMIGAQRAKLLEIYDKDLSTDNKAIKKYLLECYTEDGRRLLHAGD